MNQFELKQIAKANYIDSDGNIKKGIEIDGKYYMTVKQNSPLITNKNK